MPETWSDYLTEIRPGLVCSGGKTMSARKDRIRVGVVAACVVAVLTTGSMASQSRQGAGAPLTIQKQGSFAVGGRVLGDPNTRSLHCDHGYVDYQIPVNARRINLVMWHSAAATAWLNRWDGGEGFQSIFLRRGFPVYIWDGPQVGRAGAYALDSRHSGGVW
jgi:hypothetical protein